MANKINWLSILQGWAMLWVVVGHAGPSNTIEEYPKFALFLYQFAYSFHMSLLMFISGWLFYKTRLSDDSTNKWPYKNMICDKLVHLGVPFIVFSIIGMVVKVWFSSYVDRSSSISLSEFFNAIIYPYNGPLRELWFIGTLIWFFIVAPLWRACLKNSITITITIVLLLMLKLCGFTSEFLSIGRVSRFAIFFFFGLLFCKTKFIESIISSDCKYAVWIVLVAGIAIWALSYARNNSFVIPFAGIILSLGFALVSDKYYPNLFYSFRDYTMQIYLMGIFVQMVVKIARIKIGDSLGLWTLFYFISIISGLYIPVLVAKCAEYLNSRPLLMTIGMKQKSRVSH